MTCLLVVLEVVLFVYDSGERDEVRVLPLSSFEAVEREGCLTCRFPNCAEYGTRLLNKRLKSSYFVE